MAASVSNFRKHDKEPPYYLEQLQALADNPEAAEAAREAGKRRKGRIAEERQAREAAIEANRPETPDALIGYLAKAPEVAEAIRQIVRERHNRVKGE